jgi:hypothetical protein
MSEVFGRLSPVAQKQHTCFWCGEKILPKTKYEKWKYLNSDGPPTTVKCHAECCISWNRASEEDGYPYEVAFAEHCRGCTCERGRCECSHNESA